MAAMADLTQNFKSPAVSIYTSQSLYNGSNKRIIPNLEFRDSAADTFSDTSDNLDNNEVKQRRLKSARLIGKYAKLYLDCSSTIN
jgi:hypothetical protein